MNPWDYAEGSEEQSSQPEGVVVESSTESLNPWDFASVESKGPEASVSDELSQLGVATPESVKEQTTGDYVKDQIKLRYAQYVDWASRAGAMLGASSQTTPEFMQQELLDLGSDNRSEEIGKEYFGYEGLKPKGGSDEFAGVVGAAAADPINLALAAPSATFNTGKTLFQLSKPYTALAIEWATGTAAEVGGYYGSQVAGEAIKGSSWEGTPAETISRFAGALLGGTGFSVGTSGVLRAGTRGYKVAKEGVNVRHEEISDLLANSSVEAVVRKAIEAQNKTFGERLALVKTLEERYPGLVLPLANVVGDNAIVAKEFTRLYSSDVNFRARYDEALSKVKDQFDEIKATEFPTAGAPESEVRKTVMGEVNTRTQAKLGELTAKQERLQVAKDKVAAKYDETPLSDSIQKAADNLHKSAESIARDAATAQYNVAFTYADQAGLSFPSESVAKMWSSAGGQRAADRFKDFPTLYSKINKYWSPKKVESSGLLMPDGSPFQKGSTLEFKDVPIREMDSLKREINRLIRVTDDPVKKDTLGQLKTQLDSEIISLDPEFALKYKKADSVYYEKLGLPTSLEGYRSYDSAKLATSVASALTRPEQIRDYLSFVGPGGIDVVRDSFLLRARSSILRNGEVDPSKLKAFVARNKEALEQVPQVKALFDNDVRLVESIDRARAAAESRYNVYALEQSSGFFKVMNDENLTTVANNMLKPGNRAKYLEQINTLSPANRKMALRGVQQAMLDKAMVSSGSMFEYVFSHKDAFNDTFGPEYVENLKSLSVLYDVVEARKEDLVSSSISHARDTKFREATGATIEETIGTLRNQILSTQRKFIHLASKAFQTKTTAKADKALADALLDTNSLDSLAGAARKLTEAVDGAGSTAQMGKAAYDFFKTFSRSLGGFITKGAVLGASGGTIGDSLENESSMLPTMEEDDALFSPLRPNDQQ